MKRLNKISTVYGAIFLLMASLMLIVYGCGTENPALGNSSIQDSSILLELQRYNDSRPSVNQTRGIGWKGWLSVAIADGSGACKGARYGTQVGALLGPDGAAVGAVAGGIIGGAAGSLSQYKISNTISRFTPYSMTVSSPKINRDTLTLLYAVPLTIPDSVYFIGLANGLDSCSVQIAYKHNLVVDAYEQLPTDSIISRISANLSELETRIITSSDFVTGYNEIVENPLDFSSSDNTVADQLMQLFFDEVYDSCQSKEDMEEIVRTYARTITSTTLLTDDEKTWLKAGLAVTYYSFLYWSERWPYTTE